MLSSKTFIKEASEKARAAEPCKHAKKLGHILISFSDNPKFSLYTTRLGRDCLNRKNVIGFDERGQGQYFSNSPGVFHLLFENTSLEEFQNAISHEPIKFRVADAQALTTASGGFQNYELDIKRVLANELLELAPTQYVKASM